MTPSRQARPRGAGAIRGPRLDSFVAPAAPARAPHCAFTTHPAPRPRPTQQYRTPWPLHLLFTQRTLSQYDALFELLFALRRASFHLTKAWIGITRWREGGSLLRPHRKDALLLRARLAFFVDTLLNHIQTDVISTLEHKLHDRLRQCGDFHAAVAAHSAFLADAAKGAFIRVRVQPHLARPTRRG